MNITPVLAMTAWVALNGLLEACASRSGGLGAPSQQGPAQHIAPEQTARPGQDGTIILKGSTWLGDLLLKPGQYEFQRSVDRGEARLRVIEVKRYLQFKRGLHVSKKLLAEVHCEMESLGETASETAVHIRSDGVARVDWVTLAGEDGRCLPGVGPR